MEMKKWILTIVMVLSSSLVFAQSALFKKYENVQGVSTVYISKALLGMMPKLDVGDKDISRIAGKLDHVQILSCERPSLIPSVKAAALGSFKSGGYANLMTVTDDGEQTIIYGKSLGKGKSEFVLLSIEKTELNIINVMGNITLNDIKQIAK